MEKFLSIGEAAQLVGIPAGKLSVWFYRGFLDGSSCPVIAGRRVIPSSFLKEIREKAIQIARRQREGKQGKAQAVGNAG